MPTDLLASIESEIRAGLATGERDRIDAARKCLDFYHGRFDAYPSRQVDASYKAGSRERHSLLMQRVVDTLTANLYADGPGRLMPDHPEAEAWLGEVYRANTINAMLQEADRLSTISDVCAVQAAGGDDPDRPVELTLWDASSFVAWCDPDDPRQAVAVATIDRYDETRRLRLWTADVLVTYQTAKLGPGQTAGATAFTLTARDDNPYGVLPFAFVHHRFPATDFWSGGPGSAICDVNDYCNSHLTDSGDCLRFNGKPIVLLEGVSAGWHPPSPIRPGDVWRLPPGADAAGQGPEPHAGYLQADLGFVAASWDDFDHFIDHTLEMVGIPPGTIRLKVEAASGVSIIAEQVPLLLWARGRQRPFSCYELALAKLVLAIGAAHLGAQADAGYRATAAQLDAAAAAPGLVLRWPSLYPRLPGPDQDAADATELEMGLTSRIRLLMARRNMTRDEAVAELESIAEDRELEQKLLGPTEPPPPGAPTDGTAPLATDNEDGSDASDDDTDTETD